MKLQKSLVIPLVLIFGILIILLSTIQQSTTFAQTTDDPKATKSVNGVSMRVVFHFNAGVEETTTFKVFTFLEGYDKKNTPKFQLVGIVDGNTPLLHEATHATFHTPGIETQ